MVHTCATATKFGLYLACVAAVLSVQTLYQAAFFLAAAIFGVLIVCALMQKQRRLAGMRDIDRLHRRVFNGDRFAAFMHDWDKTKWVGQSAFEISKIAVDLGNARGRHSGARCRLKGRWADAMVRDRDWRFCACGFRCRRLRGHLC